MKYISIALLFLSPMVNAETIIHECVLSELEKEGYKDTKLKFDKSFLEAAIKHHKKQMESLSNTGLDLEQPDIDDSAWYLIKLGDNSWVIRNSNCHVGGKTGATTSKLKD
jgi:hypothetical protein